MQNDSGQFLMSVFGIVSDFRISVLNRWFVWSSSVEMKQSWPCRPCFGVAMYVVCLDCCCLCVCVFVGLCDCVRLVIRK